MGVHSASNNLIAAFSGIIGGLYQFVLNIKVPTVFMSKLGEAAITAAVCGFLGVLGKELYKVLRNAIVGYFRNRKKDKPHFFHLPKVQQDNDHSPPDPEREF